MVFTTCWSMGRQILVSEREREKEGEGGREGERERDSEPVVFIPLPEKSRRNWRRD